jgi:hypothetical protein
MIRELVACEHEYINTDHPDFIGGTRAVKVRQQNSVVWHVTYSSVAVCYIVTAARVYRRPPRQH